jgi:ABC-2 type transport system ATP-binding protein
VNAGISIEGLSHRYGPKLALDDVTFSVGAGRFCALFGPNGAGKSTLVSLLTGLFAARQGRIVIAGHDMAKDPRRALGAMGIVFQSPALDTDLTVSQNMTYYAALHGMSGSAAAVAIDESLDRLAMRERLSEKVRDLNGGHRRRMEIARALIHKPRVLLLDEPTAGLDMAMRKSITAHVHELAEHGGLSVLWTTHLADEVSAGDDLAILHRGMLVAHGQAEEVVGSASVTEVFQSLTGAQEQMA